jgi:diadenylate cyclase
VIDHISEYIYKPFLEIIKNFNLINLFEILIIGFILFALYFRFIRGTQSEKFVKGVIILLVALVFSKLLILLDLQILGKFIETLVSIILFGLVVIFQPELRRFLGYLGQPGLLNKNMFNFEPTSDDSNCIDEIGDAIKYLSKSRTGALIVMQDRHQNSHYSEVGTKINAIISTELLLTIFHPNTALHDGAVLIGNDKILSAGVLLPLTEDPKLSWQYGTRHRAAIGMSEISDAVCIVVSEETGSISIVKNGELHKMDSSDELKTELKKILGYDSSESEKSISLKKFNINNILNNNVSKLQDLFNQKISKK